MVSSITEPRAWQICLLPVITWGTFTYKASNKKLYCKLGLCPFLTSWFLRWSGLIFMLVHLQGQMILIRADFLLST